MVKAAVLGATAQPQRAFPWLLGPPKLTLPLRWPTQALARAVIVECKQLLGLPQLQTWLAREWRGGLLGALATGQAEPPWGAAVRLSTSRRLGLLLLTLLVVVPANLLLLPLVAAAPPLGVAVRASLRKFGACCAPRHSAAAKHGYR